MNSRVFHLGGVVSTSGLADEFGIEMVRSVMDRLGESSEVGPVWTGIILPGVLAVCDELSLRSKSVDQGNAPSV